MKNWYQQDISHFVWLCVVVACWIAFALAIFAITVTTTGRYSLFFRLHPQQAVNIVTDGTLFLTLTGGFFVEGDDQAIFFVHQFIGGSDKVLLIQSHGYLSIRGSVARIPLVWLLVPLAVAPILSIRRYHLRLKLKYKNSCSTCGYCLYGSKGEICPECGCPT